MIALVLQNPKTPFNVGGVIRAASIFGAAQVWWTGERVGDGREVSRSTGTNLSNRKWRLPREERMRAYDIEWGRDEGALDRLIGDGFTPVCVEIVQGAEPLHLFEHPEGDTVYVFGPEDSGVSRGIRTLCHRFVQIPGAHCLNLACACNVVLYDRWAKTMAAVPA